MVAKLDNRYLWKDDGKPGSVSNCRQSQSSGNKSRGRGVEINLPPEVSAEVVKVLLILSENALKCIVKLVLYKAMIARVRYVKRIIND